CPTEGVQVPVLSLPIAYYLELTPVCNNRCPGCGNVYADNRASLAHFQNGASWSNLIARLAQHARQFKVTGGEPTLHPEFEEIALAITEHQIPFTLFTNGRWSNPEKLVQFLLEKTTCEGMLISLHGPDAATHEAFSGVPGSFAETAANIRMATAAGVQIATSIVINAINWDRIAETLEVALSLGANHVVCNRLIGTPIPGFTPDAVQLRAAMDSIERLRAAGLPIRFGNCIPQCFAPSSSSGCSAGISFATIDPMGRMRPCNHVPLIAGDLRVQSVEEVWHSPVMESWRGLVPDSCTTCPAFSVCHGGCRAQALLNGQKQDPLITEILETFQEDAGQEKTYALCAGLRPLAQFESRIESDLQLLIHKNLVIPVPDSYRPLVAELNGTRTLSQIGSQYGSAALDWLGELHDSQMIIWA
ncbi:MAG: radical SAM protein, partial [Anaerolineae bacterium]|nr:radical SAM protein [Anaerolineae bacterium]